MQTLRMILEKAAGSSTMFAKHFPEDGAQATQLQDAKYREKENDNAPASITQPRPNRPKQKVLEPHNKKPTLRE